MAVYDSSKTRYIAKLTNRLSDCMDAEVKSKIRIALETPESIRGRTAQVMEEKLEQLFREAAGIEEDMLALAHVINAYADLLESADEQLAEEL